MAAITDALKTVKLDHPYFNRGQYGVYNKFWSENTNASVL